MTFFARLPLARKLVLTMMATSTAALLVACGFFLTYDATSFRRNAADHLQSLADITAANVTAALTYDDPKHADLVLRSLQADSHIVAARIYDSQGKPFASYRRLGAARTDHLPDLAPPKGSRLEPDDVTECADIAFDGEPIGSVYLVADLQEVKRRAQRFVWFALVLMAASSAAAFLVAMRLKRVISQPVLELLTVTRTVSRERNFSIRATASSLDEMGALVDGFNEMLAEIQLAEAALRDAHAESELFINAVPSILIGTDHDGLITRWNLTAAAVFGIPADAILALPLRNCGMHWVHPQLNQEIDSWFRVGKLEKRDNVMF
ncbi:MAG TPA: CHASE sensor domain-containing protein [Anaerolineales bacterium]|nr:CHASE sensor domain-containing protein [Anaerolineales bacterium]